MRMDFTVPLAEEYGVVLLLPQSRKGVWTRWSGSSART